MAEFKVILGAGSSLTISVPTQHQKHSPFSFDGNSFSLDIGSRDSWSMHEANTEVANA